MDTHQKIIIIGSGVAGLATACLLAKKGFEVEIYEKNEQTGGRARIFSEKGYMFDMGPSWYMMPDIFEHFFNLVGEKISDYYKLEKLSPSYRIFSEGKDDFQDFYSDFEKNYEIFEKIEKGAGENLRKHLAEGKYQYEIAKKEFMFKNYDSIWDLLNKRVVTEGRKLPLLKSIEKIVDGRFENDLLKKVLKYQTVLLGTDPKETPGIYSLMNHIDFDLGIWYPQGGMRKIIEALEKIALKNKVRIFTNSPVKEIIFENDTAKSIILENGDEKVADYIISNADLTFTDLKLSKNLIEPKKERNESYWKKRRMSPSGFIMYLGVKGKIDTLSHHNLYFAKDWSKSTKEVFAESQKWPENPSYYVSCPSKTDKTVAPENCENIFVLVPISPNLNYSEKNLEEYKNYILGHMEKKMKINDLKNRIEYCRLYSVKDFEKDYNAYKGNALSGMAHTLMQTAFFRPNNVHKEIKNFLYVGAGTNPGIGVPICLISAELVYKRIMGIKNPEPLQELDK